uniref:Uncharacterized protein n=1 Tax=Cacopsylla melanoneura TaxID=428564 RepID=A0A8D8Z8A4_9HEMI
MYIYMSHVHISVFYQLHNIYVTPLCRYLDVLFINFIYMKTMGGIILSTAHLILYNNCIVYIIALILVFSVQTNYVLSVKCSLKIILYQGRVFLFAPIYFVLF